jgi:hypothetical protein
MITAGRQAGKSQAQLAWLEEHAHPDDVTLLRCDLLANGFAVIDEGGRRIPPAQVPVPRRG